jgi:hypothetical protein
VTTKVKIFSPFQFFQHCLKKIRLGIWVFGYLGIWVFGKDSNPENPLKILIL